VSNDSILICFECRAVVNTSPRAQPTPPCSGVKGVKARDTKKYVGTTAGSGSSARDKRVG